MTLGDLLEVVQELIAESGVDHPAVGFIRLTTTADIARQCLDDSDDIEEMIGEWMTKNGEPD